MELPEPFTLYWMAMPDQTAKAGRYGLLPAHMAYRVGNGPHLFRSHSPMPVRDGVMVLEHQGYDGLGNPDSLCQEILRECTARSFCGVFCDFEGPPLPVLRRAVEHLAPAFQKRRWSLYVPEEYALQAPAVKVVVSTALSGGSLRRRLEEMAERFGPDHVALGLEWVAEDFTLPALKGAGQPLEREELDRLLRQRSPAVYFDCELCAHYFTYMTTGQRAHFVLFDDSASMVQKLSIAAALGIREGFLPDPGEEKLLEELFCRPDRA